MTWLLLIVIILLFVTIEVNYRRINSNFDIVARALKNLERQTEAQEEELPEPERVMIPKCFCGRTLYPTSIYDRTDTWACECGRVFIKDSKGYTLAFGQPIERDITTYETGDDYCKGKETPRDDCL